MRHLAALLALALAVPAFGQSLNSSSSPVSTSDYDVNVTRGLLPGQSIVHKFGRNDNVANATWERVDLLSDTGATYLSSASAIRIKAGGDAADAAAGAGAREVTVQGCDATGEPVTAVLATNGISASTASTETFLRVWRAWVSSAGTYGAANTAAIVIEDSGGTTDLLTIAAGEGQTQFAGYTVPAGKRAFLRSVFVSVDAAQAADVRFFAREDADDATAPVAAARIKLYFDGIQAPFLFKPNAPLGPYSALTDLWWEAQGGGAAAAVSVDFELLLEDE